MSRGQRNGLGGRISPMSPENKCIVLCFDSKPRTRQWATVAIESIIRHKPEDVSIAVISDSPFSMSKVDWIDAKPYIEQLRLDRISRFKYRKNEHVSPMVVFRLVLPLVKELSRYKQLVYLDCDVEVVDKKFFNIFNEDITGYDFGACWDAPYIPYWEFMHDNQVQRYFCKNAKQRFLAGNYVNSGVLLVNRDGLVGEKENYEKFISDAIDNFLGHGFFLDQDLLNVCFSIRLLDDAYNMTPEKAFQGRNAFLIHYTGHCKMGDTYPPLKERERIIGLKEEQPIIIEWSKYVDKIYLIHEQQCLESIKHIQYNIKRFGLDISDVFQIETYHREGQTLLNVRESVIKESMKKSHRKILIMSDYTRYPTTHDKMIEVLSYQRCASLFGEVITLRNDT